MNINSILNSIHKANHMFNETLTLHYINKEKCPSCNIDPVSGETSDINCSVCGGDGYIETETTIDIPVSHEFVSDYEINYTKAGKFDDNEILVTIDTQEIEQYNIDVEKVEYFTWNNTKYRLKSKEPGTLAGNIFEINCVLEKIV